MDIDVLYEINKKFVHYTSVCSMMSIDMFMLTVSVLLVSGKQM